MYLIIMSFIIKIKRFFYKKSCVKQVKKVVHPLYVNGKSNFGSNTFLGKNTNFNGIDINGCGKVVIGDNFHSGPGCLFITQNHNYNNGSKIPYDNTYTCNDIFIKDNVWMGSRVIVIGKVTIGEGVIIQAGSVVVSNIEDFCIVGGHPARVFSKRDKEHYMKLKNKKQFH
jgi:chloramphenicol O-acetyltransferase type B